MPLRVMFESKVEVRAVDFPKTTGRMRAAGSRSPPVTYWMRGTKGLLWSARISPERSRNRHLTDYRVGDEIYNHLGT